MSRPSARLRVRTTLVATSALALVAGVFSGVVTAPALADAPPQTITLTSGVGVDAGAEDSNIQYLVQDDGAASGNAVVVDTSVSLCHAYRTIGSSRAQFVTACLPDNGCYNNNGSSLGTEGDLLTTTYMTSFTLPNDYSGVELDVHYLADNYTSVSL